MNRECIGSIIVVIKKERPPPAKDEGLREWIEVIVILRRDGPSSLRILFLDYSS